MKPVVVLLIILCTATAFADPIRPKDPKTDSTPVTTLTSGLKLA